MNIDDKKYVTNGTNENLTKKAEQTVQAEENGTEIKHIQPVEGNVEEIHLFGNQSGELPKGDEFSILPPPSRRYILTAARN